MDYGDLAEEGMVEERGMPVWWDAAPLTDPSTTFQDEIGHGLDVNHRECLSWSFSSSGSDCVSRESDRMAAERLAGEYFEGLIRFDVDHEQYEVPPEAFVEMLLDQM